MFYRSNYIMLIFLIVYLVITIIVFLNIRKYIFIFGESFIPYRNLIQWSLLLMCLTLPMTLIFYTMDSYINGKNNYQE